MTSWQVMKHMLYVRRLRLCVASRAHIVSG
jgi:hypothetical protein